jgi:hypothetical protein
MRAAATVLIVSLPAPLLYYIPPHQLSPEWAELLSSAMCWAAITTLLVAAPVLGKAARTGIERCIGTVAGGLAALAIALAASPALFAVAMPIVAFLGLALGSALGLDYAGKLFPITFIVVVSAVLGKPGHVPVLIAAGARTAGIVTGVLAVMVTSVLLWPSAASDLAVEALAASLSSVADLADATFRALEASRSGREARAALARIQKGALEEGLKVEGGIASTRRALAEEAAAVVLAEREARQRSNRRRQRRRRRRREAAAADNEPPKAPAGPGAATAATATVSAAASADDGRHQRRVGWQRRLVNKTKKEEDEDNLDPRAASLARFFASQTTPAPPAPPAPPSFADGLSAAGGDGSVGGVALPPGAIAVAIREQEQQQQQNVASLPSDGEDDDDEDDSDDDSNSDDSDSESDDDSDDGGPAPRSMAATLGDDDGGAKTPGAKTSRRRRSVDGLGALTKEERELLRRAIDERCEAALVAAHDQSAKVPGLLDDARGELLLGTVLGRRVYLPLLILPPLRKPPAPVLPPRLRKLLLDWDGGGDSKEAAPPISKAASSQAAPPPAAPAPSSLLLLKWRPWRGRGGAPTHAPAPAAAPPPPPRPRHLPVQAILSCRRAVSRAARCAWSLHLVLRGGFDERMMSTLSHRYPAFLLDRLSASSRRFLRDAAEALARAARGGGEEGVSGAPLGSAPLLDRTQLEQYRKTVETVLAVSRAQRKQIREHLLRYGMAPAQQQQQAPTPTPPPMPLLSPQPSSLTRYAPGAETPRAPAPPLAFQQDASSAAILTPAVASGGGSSSLVDIERALSMLSNRERGGGVGGAPHAPRGSGEGAGAGGAMASTPPAAVANPSWPAPSAPRPILLTSPFALAPLKTQASSTSAACTPPGGAAGNLELPQTQQQTPTPTLQLRVDTPRLLFQEGDEDGLNDKVRWYSFVYAAEQLLDEMEHLAECVDAVLAGLPRRRAAAGKRP